MNGKSAAHTALILSGVVTSASILYLGGNEALFRVVHGDPVYLLAMLLPIAGITLLGALRWCPPVSALTRQPVEPLRLIYRYSIIGRLISLFAPEDLVDLGCPLALRAGGGSSLGITVYSSSWIGGPTTS
jgi:hypothetical protein